jgi:hypothetical protein
MGRSVRRRHDGGIARWSGAAQPGKRCGSCAAIAPARASAMTGM